MGLLKKIVKPFKKLATFTGKVVKGAESGGLVGAAAAFVKNVGGRSKKKKVSTSSPGATPKTKSAEVRFNGSVFTT